MLKKQKAVTQWEQLSSSSRLVNRMAYEQRVLSKYKPIRLLDSVNEREMAKLFFFKLLQHKQFGEEMKFL